MKLRVAVVAIVAACGGDDVHDQIVHFFVTHRTIGIGEITIP